MISNNNNNIISLQKDSFVFLSVLIKGILNSALKSEETDQLIEDIVVLIISSKYFETEVYNNLKNTKENITIFEDLKMFLKNYIKITQNNLWEKWYEFELERKKKESSDEDAIKEEIILDICKNMIFLQISKSTIKKKTDNINKIAFGEGS